MNLGNHPGRSLTLVFVLLAAIAGCSKPPFTDAQGQPVSLRSDQGQWLVLNFWADWCDPCREEVPELNELGQSGQVRVVGLDFDGSQGESLKSKVAALGIQFPVLQQSPLEQLKEKAPQVLPATYILSPEGKVVDRLYGPQTRSGLEERIQQLQAGFSG